MHTYEMFSGKELKVAELIQQRRLQLLVHSYIYYELDQNIISDSTWSKWATELAKLQNDHQELSNKIRYAELFVGWDGSSGAFLKYDDSIIKCAERLLTTKIVEQKVEKPKIEKPKDNGQFSLF